MKGDMNNVCLLYYHLPFFYEHSYFLDRPSLVWHLLYCNCVFVVVRQIQYKGKRKKKEGKCDLREFWWCSMEGMEETRMDTERDTQNRLRKQEDQ